MSALSELYTMAEAARYAGLSKRQTIHLVHKMRLPVVRIGRQMLIRRDDAPALLDRPPLGRPVGSKSRRPRRPRAPMQTEG